MSTQSGGSLRQFLEARLQSRPRIQDLFGQRTVAVRQAGARRDQSVPQLVRAAGRLLDETADALGRCRLGPEVLDVVAAGKRSLHFRDAAAGLQHVALIGDLLVAAASRIRTGDQALLVDEPVEIGDRHRPCVALVLDELVHAGDRRALAVVNKLDGPEQRRRVGEAGDTGEEAADLDLGIDTGLELALQLDDVAVVHMQRRAGVSGFDRPDGRRLPERLVAELCGRLELQPEAERFG